MRIHKEFNPPVEVVVDSDCAYYYDEEVKYDLPSGTKLKVIKSYDNGQMAVYALDDNGNGLNVQAFFLNEWEKLFNIDPEVILKRVRMWQEEPVFHQLTCGNNSRHQLLKGKIQNDKIMLYCLDCKYTQHYLPDLFYVDSFEEMYYSQKEFLDMILNS